MHISAGIYLIRSWQAGDEPALARNLGNPNITRNLATRLPRSYSIEHAKAWIDLCALEADPVNFAIVDAYDSVIGGIGLTLQRGTRRRSAEIGFWIDEDRWGEGVATEAVSALSDFAFNRFELIRLFAYVFAGNDASVRVLEKAGYAYEGRMRKSIVKDDRVVDELVYALVR
jgi:RimJ/RimL family protein N-acetyltransferase